MYVYSNGGAIHRPFGDWPRNFMFSAGHHGLVSFHIQINHTNLVVTSNKIKFYCWSPRSLRYPYIAIAQILIHVHPPGGSTELVVTNNMSFVGSHKSSPGSI